jgi:hypothetical protein
MAGDGGLGECLLDLRKAFLLVTWVYQSVVICSLRRVFFSSVTKQY